jgi:hypothetical protein
MLQTTMLSVLSRDRSFCDKGLLLAKLDCNTATFGGEYVLTDGPSHHHPSPHYSSLEV